MHRLHAPLTQCSLRATQEHWHYVSELYPVSKDEFLDVLNHHWHLLMIASGLLAFVLLLVLLASCVLRSMLLAAAQAPLVTTQAEMAGLMQGDGGGDDEL